MSRYMGQDDMYGGLPENRIINNQGFLHHENYTMQNNQGINFRKPSKQEIINWFKNAMGCRELDLIDDSSSNVARHVCLGGTNIELLPRRVYNLQIPGGIVVLEYYQCMKCGKIILNRNFM